MYKRTKLVPPGGVLVTALGMDVCSIYASAHIQIYYFFGRSW